MPPPARRAYNLALQKMALECTSEPVARHRVRAANSGGGAVALRRCCACGRVWPALPCQSQTCCPFASTVLVFAPPQLAASDRVPSIKAAAIAAVARRARWEEDSSLAEGAGCSQPSDGASLSEGEDSTNDFGDVNELLQEGPSPAYPQASASTPQTKQLVPQSPPQQASSAKNLWERIGAAFVGSSATLH